MGVWHEDVFIFMTISPRVLLTMRNITDKSCTGNKKHILCSITFFFSDNRIVYDIRSKNMVQRETPQMTIWRMPVACWISNATRAHAHAHRKSCNTAFPRQQWNRERASVLPYTHYARLVRYSSQMKTKKTYTVPHPLLLTCVCCLFSEHKNARIRLTIKQISSHKPAPEGVNLPVQSNPRPCN
jgi:hypothetical protein